jgi:hypothetical protein
VPLSPDPSLSNFLAVYQSQTSLACLKNPQLVVKDQKTPPKNDRMADRPTPPSAALARVTKTFAIHQDASRPRHRASVGWMAC